MHVHLCNFVLKIFFVSGVPFAVSNGSYFRIRELSSGRIISNVSESVGHAFFSAEVDYKRGQLWVWGVAVQTGNGPPVRCCCLAFDVFVKHDLTFVERM